MFAEWSKHLCDADVLEQLRCIGELKALYPLMKSRVQEAHLVYSTVWEFFNLPDMDLRDYFEISRLPKRLKELSKCVWQRVEQEREWITRKVVDRTSSNYYEVETIERELDQTLRKYKNAVRIPEVQRIALKFSQLTVRTRNLLDIEKELEGQRSLLSLPEFDVDLQKLLKISSYFEQLTDLRYKSMNYEHSLLQSHVLDINHDEILKTTEELQDKYKKLLEEVAEVEEKYLTIPANELEKVGESLEKVVRLLPVISAVRNQGMKERHWQEVLREVEMGAELRGNPVVKDLLDMNITEKAEKLEEISALAEKEMILEESLSQMRAQWNLATFEVRSKGVLISVELSSQMAAHIVKSQQILTSPYAFTILEQLRTWLDTLLQLHTFVELHSHCERLWHRVEGVFSTEDVAYQMPTEFRIFKKISFLWQQVNSRITDDKPILMQLTTIIDLNSILKELEGDFLILEKGFHSYLRKKRLVFSRLHLMDDGRLLQLLSISRDPTAVNKVIHELFPFLKLLIFNKRGEISEVELMNGTKMILSKPVNVPVAKRHVEKWLAELDRELRTTVRLKIKNLLEKHSFNWVPLVDLLDVETHIVLIFYRILFTHMIEEAMRHSNLKKLTQQLNSYISDSRSLLEQTKRSKVESILSLIQHCRPFASTWKVSDVEVTKELEEKQIIFTDDISWKKHLRMYWNLDQVFIRIFDLATRHDYDISTPISNPKCDRLIGIILTNNRFYLSLRMENPLQSARIIASALGRPLLEVCEDQPIEGGLWIGPVAVNREREFSSWLKAVSDIRNNVIGGSQKVLVHDGEIPTNPSLLPIFENFGKKVFDVESNVALMLSIYGFNERSSQRLLRYIKFIPIIFNFPALPQSVVESIWRDAISIKKAEEKSELEAISEALFYGFSPQIIDENWNDFSSLFPKTRHLWVERKEKELLRLLTTHRVVAVCGRSMAGKSRLIEATANMAGVFLQKEFNGNGWTLLDGESDQIPLIMDANQSSFLTSRLLPFFEDPSARIIFESDSVSPLFFGRIPILFVEDSDSKESWPASFSLSDVVILSKIMRQLSDFDSKLFRDRIIHLSPFLESKNISLQQLIPFILAGLSSNQERIDQILSWESMLECLFEVGFIPFLSSSHGKSPLLEKFLRVFEEKDLISVEINLNTLDSNKEIEEFLKRSELLFGGEKNVVFCLKDFHRSSISVKEFLRKNSSRRFVVTSSEEFNFYPERLRRFLFVIEEDSMGETRPIEVYEKLIKRAEFQDFLRAEMTESLLEIAAQFDVYFRTKIELGSDEKISSRFARGKELFDLPELTTIYQQLDSFAQSRLFRLQNEKRKGCKLEKEPVLTQQIAKRLSLLEKFLLNSESSIISCREAGGSSDYWIQLMAQILNLEILQKSFGVLDREDILRRCLLEDQPVLLIVNLEENPPIELIYSLVVSRCVPPSFLSQQLTTEFCEKHTVEGKGMWRRMAATLAQFLRVCLLVSKENFPTFYNKNRELSLIDWPPKDFFETVSSAIKIVLKDSKILEAKEIEEIGKKFEQLAVSEEDDRIDLVKLFIHVTRSRREAVNRIMNRYQRGMEKLRLAEEQTGSLQAELSRLRPELLRTSIETSMLMSSIERETIEVENVREVVSANEHKANQAAIAAQALRAESEADLANAIPALEASIEALETLNQSDVSTLKTMRFPPHGVRICMEAVCILLGEPPARVPNPDGGFVNDYWPTGLKMLSDIHFLARIRSFPRDSVPRKTMRIIRDRYLSNPEFDPEHIKQCSLAAEGLVLWVKAIEFYHRISRIVEPKKEKLRQAELLVKTHLKQLEVKRKALQRVTEKLQQLSDQFGQMSQRKQDLQTQISTCETRIERAERLVAALEGEKEKWLLKIESIRNDLNQLSKHCLITVLALHRYSHQPEDIRKEIMKAKESDLFHISSNFTDVGNDQLIALCSYPFLFYNDYGRGWKIVSRLFPNLIKVTRLSVSLLREFVSNGSAVFTFDHQSILLLAGEEIEISEGFRLFVSTPCTRETSQIEEWRFVSLNMEYSQEELKTQIFTCLGRKNWPEIQTASDGVRLAVQKDSELLDEIETKMLELLGRKEEDLDDEGAIELLAVTHETQERLKDRQREMANAEKKLNLAMDKLTEIALWAVRIVQFVRKFAQFSPFFNLDVEKLIELTDTEITEAELKMEKAPRLWEFFFEFCLPFFSPNKRKLLFFGLKLLHLKKNITQNDLEIALRRWEEPDQLKVLGRIIWSTDSRNPVLIGMSNPQCEIAMAIRDVSRGTFVQWTSFSDLQKMDHLSESPYWLAVTLSAWPQLEEIQKLQESLEKISNLHPTFRFLVVFPSIQNATSNCVFYPNRMCLSSPICLRSLLHHSISSSSFRQFFHSAARSKRSNAIRLIVFHFAVRKRIKGIDDVELRMALTLLKVCFFFVEKNDRQETNCDEEKELADLFIRIISTIYLPRGQNKVEKTTIEALFRWIYQGINKTDDALVKGTIWGELNEENIVQKLAKIEDEIFLGICQKRIQFRKDKKMKWMIEYLLGGIGEKKKREESLEFIHPKRRSVGMDWRSLILDEIEMDKDVKRLEYLRCLLESPKVQEVEIQFFRNPLRIVALLLAKFAISSSLPFDEIVVLGHLDSISASNRISLKNCFAKNLKVENRELKEQEDEENQRLTITLEALKKPEKREKTLPLLDGTGQFLCDILVRTNIGLAHWHLRGAHFTTK